MAAASLIDKDDLDELVRQWQLNKKRAYVPPSMAGGIEVSKVHRENGMSPGSDAALPDRLFTLGRATLARQNLLKNVTVRASVVRQAYKLADQLLDVVVCRRPPASSSRSSASDPELLAFSKRLRCCPSAAAAAAATTAALLQAADDDQDSAAATAADTRMRMELIRDVDAQLRKLATLLQPAAAMERPSGRMPHLGLERACMPFAITYEDSGIGGVLFRHTQQARPRKMLKSE